MLRPSSRNQRSRGFRLKHILQIGILVAVCIWLLYQVKHSHEKKRAYNARNSKIIRTPIENQEDVFQFGRKDLTRTEAAGTTSEIHKEEESEEAQEEEEPEVKQEETEDEEMRGAGDDGADEQNQEQHEGAERGEDSMEEEGNGGQMEETDLFDSQDHEEGTQAREENYKSDDASSAVEHEVHATDSETVTGDMDEEQIVNGSKGDHNSTIDGSKVDVPEDNTEKQEMLAGNVVNGTVDGSKADNSTIDGYVNNLSDNVKDNNSTMPIANLANNGTAAESKESEAEISNPDNASVTNSTIAEEKRQTDPMNFTTAVQFNNKMELSANSTESESEDQMERQNNSTVAELPAELQMSNDTVSVVDSAQDHNTTVDEGTLVEGEPNMENVVDQAGKSNSTTALDSEEQSATSSATNGTGDGGMGETDHDLMHAAMEEERDNRTDLSTLPDIENEARAMDDDAAE